MPGFFPPEFMSLEFWLTMVPIVLGAFVLGFIWRPRPIVAVQGRGMGALLGSASDQAVDLLAQSAELKPETINTYLALGSLFRTRGEFDRATRIHNSIVIRDDLGASVQQAALLQLGLDYLSAGLMDRAESAFQGVIAHKMADTPEHATALTALAELYERQKRWADALNARNRLHQASPGHLKAHAHLLCKMGDDQRTKGDTLQAKTLYAKAIDLHPGCLPALNALSRLATADGDHAAACGLFRTALLHRPDLFHLLEEPFVAAFTAAGDTAGLSALWREAALHPKANWRTAAAYADWLAKEGHKAQALEVLSSAYTNNPTTIETANALSRHMELSGRFTDALTVLHTHLDQKAKTFHAYQCQSCGYSSQKLFWQCPQCQKWDTVAPLSLGRKTQA